MRDLVQELTFGVTGQVVYLDCPEGRPSAVTSVTVRRSDADDSSGSESAISGSPSIDSASTTLSAAAGYDQSDQKLVSLTSATGFAAGRPYLLTATTGETAWVQLAALAGTTGYSRTPLTSAFAAGSTFASTRISATIDATWVANAANLSDESGIDRLRSDTWAPNDDDEDPRFRVEFLYTVGGLVRRREVRLDLVRYTAQHAITPVDVDQRFAGWIDRIPADYRRDQGQSLIDEAFRQVRFDLLIDGHAARWIRRPDVIGELVCCRAQAQAAELGVLHNVISLDAWKAAMGIYEARYAQLVRAPHVKIGSAPGGGIVGGRPPSPLGRR